MDFEYIILFLKMLVIVSFIMFVTRQIVKEKHIKTKGLVYLIVSLSLTLIGVVTLIIDLNNYLIFDNIWYYILFIGSALIYVIGAIFVLIKSKKFAGPVKNKVVFTLHDKIENVYVLFKHQGSLYVLKDKNTGINYKLKNTEFVDDVVNKIVSKYTNNLSRDYDKLGTITRNIDKKDNVYYCYVIETEEPLDYNAFSVVDGLKVNEMDISDLDKYIIIKSLIGIDFNDVY